ncbi:ABC transporter substrate-binding protein [Sphaerimonospora mesophila]|uniref:ABC transporter substrate-binding protein n=1 Tax=Sphaerimonospora mesophila TaxID=37483 RepID=UPI000A96F1A7
MKRRLRLLVGLAAVGSMVMTACGGSGDEPQADSAPYKIMISAGSDAGGQTDQLTTGVISARAAVKVVNDAGGINGKPVELIESPDNADPQKALSNLRAQIAKDRPDAYLVASGSNVSTAVAGILRQNEIIFLDSGNSADTNKPAENPYAFHLAAPFKTVVEGYLPQFEQNGYKKIAVLHGNSAYAKQFGALAESVFTEKGYETSVVEYDAKALDMTAQISALQAKNPDVLVFNGYGAPVGLVLQGITKLGWNVPILGDTSVTSTPLVTTMPPDGLIGTPETKNLKIEVTTSVNVATASEATKKAIEAMKSMGEIKASLNNCLNFDAVMLLAAAANHAKSNDTKAVADALLLPEVNTKAGTAVYDTYPYTADDHQPQLPIETHTFVAPGVLKDGQIGSAEN